MSWIRLAQDWDQWRTGVSALMNTGVPHKAGNCLPAPPCDQDRMSFLWCRLDSAGSGRGPWQAVMNLSLTYNSTHFSTICVSISRLIQQPYGVEVRSGHSSEPDAPPQFLNNVPDLPRRQDGWAVVDRVMNLIFVWLCIIETHNIDNQLHALKMNY
jgi:hypothetical protein